MAEDGRSDHLYSASRPSNAKTKAAIYHVQQADNEGSNKYKVNLGHIPSHPNKTPTPPPPPQSKTSSHRRGGGSHDSGVRQSPDVGSYAWQSGDNSRPSSRGSSGGRPSPRSSPAPPQSHHRVSPVPYKMHNNAAGPPRSTSAGAVPSRPTSLPAPGASIPRITISPSPAPGEPFGIPILQAGSPMSALEQQQLNAALLLQRQSPVSHPYPLAPTQHLHVPAVRLLLDTHGSPINMVAPTDSVYMTNHLRMVNSQPPHLSPIQAGAPTLVSPERSAPKLYPQYASPPDGEQLVAPSAESHEQLAPRLDPYYVHAIRAEHSRPSVTTADLLRNQQASELLRRIDHARHWDSSQIDSVQQQPEVSRVLGPAQMAAPTTVATRVSQEAARTSHKQPPLYHSGTPEQGRDAAIIRRTPPPQHPGKPDQIHFIRRATPPQHAGKPEQIRHMKTPPPHHPGKPEQIRHMKTPPPHHPGKPEQIRHMKTPPPPHPGKPEQVRHMKTPPPSHHPGKPEQVRHMKTPPPTHHPGKLEQVRHMKTPPPHHPGKPEQIRLMKTPPPHHPGKPEQVRRMITPPPHHPGKPDQVRHMKTPPPHHPGKPEQVRLMRVTPPPDVSGKPDSGQHIRRTPPLYHHPNIPEHPRRTPPPQFDMSDKSQYTARRTPPPHTSLAEHPRHSVGVQRTPAPQTVSSVPPSKIDYIDQSLQKPRQPRLNISIPASINSMPTVSAHIVKPIQSSQESHVHPLANMVASAASRTHPRAGALHTKSSASHRISAESRVPDRAGMEAPPRTTGDKVIPQSTGQTLHYPLHNSAMQLSQTHTNAASVSSVPAQSGLPAQPPNIPNGEVSNADVMQTASHVKSGSVTEKEEKLEDMETCPFNKRVKNLSNFPAAQTSYRATYRSHTVAIHRSKAGSITSAAKSLDLMRQNLQNHLNKDLSDVIQRYVDMFFKPGLENINVNGGESGMSSEDHISAVCRQILEEAKKMYASSESRSITPDVPDNVSESGSLVENRTVRENKQTLFRMKRRRGSSDSEKSIPRRKKKGRPPLHAVSGRSTPSKSAKSNEPVRREGPKWDSTRLKSDSLFVMGARANKALGLGQTRGRIYIKHPETFKYSGDPDDKQWLYENHHMPATGGKAYMLLVEDVQELAQTNEYRNNPGLMLHELVGFTIPDWMLSKMKVQMDSLRTDHVKVAKVARVLPQQASTFMDASQTGDEETRDGDDDADLSSHVNLPLPFSTLSDNVKHFTAGNGTGPSSPSKSLDLLSTVDDDDADDVSPFNLGSFEDDNGSPVANLASPNSSNNDSDAPLSAPFHVGN